MEIVEQLVAKKIRETREGRRLTLQQVAERAQISRSFLSKVERSNVSISIAALCRLATALGVSPGEFFDSNNVQSDVMYIPLADRRSVMANHRDLPYQYDVLVPKRGARQMYPTIITINGRKTKFELRQHPGEQFVLMMEGRMKYVCGDQEFFMQPGDCLYLTNARIPHGPKLKRGQKARYLAVQTSDLPKRQQR